MPNGASSRFLAIASGGLIVAGIALLPTAANAGEWPNSDVASVSISGTPVDVAFDPAGTTAFVATFTNTVAVVDVATRTVTASIPVGSTNLTTRIEASPDGGLVLVSNTSDGTVSVIDADALAVVQTIDVGEGPSGIAFSPDGSIVYVANSGDGTVSAIDTASWSVTTITVGGAPGVLAVSPDGSELWVPGDANDGVTVIDTATLAIVTSIIGMPEQPVVVAFAPGGAAAFIGLGNGGTGGVARVDPATRTVTDSLGGLPLAGEFLADLLVTPDGETLFAVSYSGALTVIDAATLDIITQTVDTTLRPGAALSPGGELWVAIGDPSSVEIYAFENPSVTTTTLPDGVGGAPYGPVTIAAVNPSTLPVSFSSPDLPSWLFLDPTTGSLSGTPPAIGATYSFTVVATDTEGHEGSAALAILVRDPLAIESLVVIPSDTRVLQGSTISLDVAAQQFGGARVPISSGVTFSSDVPSDAIAGSTVTFRDASTHTITAQWGSFSSEVAIVVIPVIDGEVQWPDTVVDVLGPSVDYTDVAVSPDSATAYATRSGGLDVIDTATGVVRASVAPGIAGGPFAGVEVSPDGSLVAVGSGDVVLVDAATLAAATVVTDGSIEDVAFSPDGTTVVAIGDALWIIDVATASVTATAPVTGSYVTVSPDGEIWVSGDDGISIVGLASGAILATIPTSVNSRVTITPDGTTALSCDSPTRIAFIDVASRAVTRSIPIAGGHEYCAMWLKPGGTEAYFVASPLHPNQGGEGVGVALLIDVEAATIADTIPYTGFASGLALAPDGSIGYIAQYYSGIPGGLAVLEYGGADPLLPVGPLASTGLSAQPDAMSALALGLVAGGVLVGTLARARRRPLQREAVSPRRRSA
jgi:YVTN family beta-propeller protein